MVFSRFTAQQPNSSDDGARMMYSMRWPLRPDGLSPDVKARARTTIRLSAMTLPHALCRVLLAEQIYRAWSIYANHPYHRA